MLVCKTLFITKINFKDVYTANYNYRNPTHSQRPPFYKISATLNASSSTLLQWTGGDLSVAGELGSPLSEAAFLYQDLQSTFNNVNISH